MTTNFIAFITEFHQPNTVLINLIWGLYYLGFFIIWELFKYSEISHWKHNINTEKSTKHGNYLQ